MADWGLYSALRGTDDWQTKREDKKMNLLAAEKMELRQQNKVAQAAAAETEINKYLEELQNLEVLPEDQERVNQAERRARQKVVKGIANANGDLRKYMSTGGITALGEYKTNVMKSEEVKQAGVNKINLGNYLKQEEKGNQRHKLVDVSVPLFEEDGVTPKTDADGNQLTETKKMSWQDQFNLYKEGKIKQLNYSGSETRINMGVEDFNKMYKNPNDIYQEDNYVTESNIYEKMLSKGASEEYAREQAKLYGEMYKKGGDAWRWNAGDKTALDLQKQQLSLARRKQRFAERSAQEARDRYEHKGMLTNEVPTAIQNLQPGKSHDMAPKEIEWWQKTFQMGSDAEKGQHFPNGMMATDAHTGTKVDLGRYGAQNVFFDKIVAREGDDGKINKYVEAQVTIPDPDTWFGSGLGDWEDLPFHTNFFKGFTPLDEASRNWQNLGGGDYRGTVLIPVDKQMSNATFKTQMNKYIGTTTAAEWTAASITNEDEYQQAMLDMEYLRQTIPAGPALDQALMDYQNGTFENVTYE